jgi:hypothetical protein
MVGDHAVRQCLQHSKEGLRACFPKDLMDIVWGIAAFEQQHPKFDLDDVDRAVSTYFVD